jgi:hypothetical protein
MRNPLCVSLSRPVRRRTWNLLRSRNLFDGIRFWSHHQGEVGEAPFHSVSDESLRRGTGIPIRRASLLRGSGSRVRSHVEPGGNPRVGRPARPPTTPFAKSGVPSRHMRQMFLKTVEQV